MSKRKSESRKRKQSSYFCRRAFLCGTLALVGATGCQNITRRGQSPDESGALLTLAEERQVDTTKYVGRVTGIWGNNYATIEGIGLAGNLKGTGSNPKPSWQTDHLSKELSSREEITNPKTLLANEDTAMVLVKAYLPPGIRKGDNFDLEIRTPPKSDTTSLFDGRLSRTRLRTLQVLGRKVREGHVLGLGQGSILIDSMFESRQDQSNRVRGWVLGGGVATKDRPLGLSIRTEDHTFRTSSDIAAAINERFTTIENQGRVGCATATTDKLIELLVPREYKHNISRYLQAVRNTAYNEAINDRVERLSQLDKELNEPLTCSVAAIRLEAMGEEGIPALTRALRHPDLEVRFHAAQALAYLGEEVGVEQLLEAAETEPAFRWHALTALATLEKGASTEALEELLHVESAETRYGAFRSLKAQSPFGPLVRGESLSDFVLNVVPSKSEPMMHISRSKQNEIVLFGETQTVSDEVLYVESGLTVKGNGDGSIKITRYLPGEGEVRKVCSNQAVELLPTLSELGCSYSVIVKLLRDAQQNEMLNTRLVVNAIPKRRRKYRGDRSTGEESKKYIADPIPDLFQPQQEQAEVVPKGDITRSENTETNEETEKSSIQQGRLWSKLEARAAR